MFGGWCKSQSAIIEPCLGSGDRLLDAGTDTSAMSVVNYSCANLVVLLTSPPAMFPPACTLL
jgi:hypothetical protein